MTAGEQTQRIAEQARELGFDLCGVTTVEEYVAGLERMPEWLARGYAGEMKYLHDPRRFDPQRVLEGARSIIVCAMNYNTDRPYSTEVVGSSVASLPSERQAERETRNAKLETRKTNALRGWISRYAWGDDYHEVLGERMKSLVAAMRKEFSEPFEALWYVDTGPVVERVAAQRAGLGWLAKNTCLINEKLGSWLFLGVIVTTLDLAPSLGPAEAPPADLCGQCTQCIDACPTGAIVEPYVLDARRCISYLTIELRGSIPEEFHEPMGRHVFGCDICQDVCPWNRKAPVTPSTEFHPRALPIANKDGKNETRKPKLEIREEPETLFAPKLEWLASLTEKEFREIFRGSAIRRTKWRGLRRNAQVALENKSAKRRQRPAPRTG